VGPLARLNTCTYIDTELAAAARREFHAKLGEVSQATMAYHWARMIELLHAGEKIRELIDDPDLLGDDRVAPWGTRREEAVAIIEAPRGTLLHHYEVDENDQVVMANLIVSTTNNNEAMNRTVRRIADSHLSGRSEITEPMLNNIEVGIRAYDPCLSCATHALGQMPLEVTLLDHRGELLDRRAR
jgi:NAD-reducing hydrogenase large subunit